MADPPTLSVVDVQRVLACEDDPVRSDVLTARACPRAKGHAGFTLIELVVAMVLLSLVVAMVGTVIIKALSGSSTSRAGALSDAAVARTVEALQNDIARAVTQHRDEGRLRDPMEFANAVRSNQPAHSSNPADNNLLLDIDEVVLATPTELRLRANVANSAGYECVTWSATTTAGTFRLIRRVASATSMCGTAGLGEKTFLSAPAGLKGVVTSPFSFEMLCNRTLCAGSEASPAQPCRPWQRTTAVPAGQRRWVVAINARFRAGSAEGGGSAADGTVSTAIRSRDTEQYRTALGC
jgi:prepilin-type N-terminal cleavage/methylation domain-containing protein